MLGPRTRCSLAVASVLAFGLLAARADADHAQGTLSLLARHRVLVEGATPRIVEQDLRWAGERTAFIVCDMWDQHWCKGASARVAEMAPALDRALAAARARGVLVIHAPSDTLEFYAGMPQRERARSAAAGHVGRESQTPAAAFTGEPPLPIDASNGGCACEPRCAPGAPWTREIAALTIAAEDVVTDRGEEIAALLDERGMRNVFVAGVHANMCVLDRPFGIRSLRRQGLSVVLVRDLTDTMYDPRASPWVSHGRGTDLVIEHIERWLCPTIESTSLTDEAPFRFAADRRLEVAFVIGEDEYQAARTLPAFAAEELERRLGWHCTFTSSPTPTHIAGLEALTTADLAVFFVRRRTLPEDELATVRTYLDSKKPLVALRTSSHAFQNWLEFDPLVLGGHYQGHHGDRGNPSSFVWVDEGAREHPIVRGLPDGEIPVPSSLYRTSPLEAGTRPLLYGRVEGEAIEPVAWTRESEGRRVFYTSLGHPGDFELPYFRRLLRNAIAWAADCEPLPDPETPTPHERAARGERLGPAEERACFELAPGVEATLAASDPMIVQPVDVQFDERGRMWVVQYVQYMYPAGLTPVAKDEFDRTVYDRVPAPPPHGPRGADRITICEDRDGDGYHEYCHDFVDGLNLATSVAIGHGGVWIAQTPYVLFYPDHDRDDRPDADPEVVLEGFGMEDAHAVVNSLTWGPDGWLYGAQGSTCTARVRGHVFQQAAWRLHPETREFEVFAEGGGNTFGLDFDGRGELLTGTNWGGFVLVHYVQGGYYFKNFGKHGPLTNPHAYGFFEHAPHEGEAEGHVAQMGVVYRAEALPERFRERWIVPHLLGNRICAHALSPDGSSYRTRHEEHLVLSHDRWFRPVDLALGPDGALYVADWYDKRATHLIPVDDWDKTSGRIWRLSTEGTPAADAFDLATLASRELVDRLAAPNAWLARTSLRLLDERDDASVHELLWERLEAAATPELALEHLWALWTSGGIRAAGDWTRLARHRFAEVRAWTARLAADRLPVPIELEGLLLGMDGEQSPLVRCQLASSARRLGADAAIELVRRLSWRDEDTKDPHTPLLLWWAIEPHAIAERERLLFDFGERTSIWNASRVDSVLAPLVRRWSEEGDAASLSAVARLLALAPERDALQELQGVAANHTSGAELASALAFALRGRTITNPPSELLAAIEALPAEPGSAAELDRLLLRLRLGSASARDRALELVAASGTLEGTQRIALITALGELAPEGSMEALLAIALDEGLPTVRAAALDALQHFDAPTIAPALLGRWTELRADAALRARSLELLSRRADWARALLEAVAAGVVASDEIPGDIVARLAQHDEPRVRALHARLYGAPSASAPEKRARIEALELELTGTEGASGDLARGRALYTEHCARCHQLFGAGETIGPSLTDYERTNLAALLVAIVDPSVAIREGFEDWVLETKDGLLLTGLLVAETAETITIEDAQRVRTTVERESVAALRLAGLSRMPEGLLDPLDAKALRDLFAYLRSNAAEAQR